MEKVKVLISQLKSYIDTDTRLEIFPDPLYIVINAETGNVIDCGYKSYRQAKKVFNGIKYQVIN